MNKDVKSEYVSPEVKEQISQVESGFCGSYPKSSHEGGVYEDWE